MTHAYLLGSAGLMADAGLPLTDRGFRYGMSVFETLAIRRGIPLLLDPHLERIDTSASNVKFRPAENWRARIRERLLAPPILEGVARIYVTAGDYDGGDCRVALLFEEMTIPTELTHARAVSVEFTPPTPFGKTGNYWPHFLARPASGDEAILCTPGGMLLGGATANIFLARGGELLTPLKPVRHGVVANWVGGSKAPLERADLLTADDAFLTNSRLGMCRLTEIDGRTLPGDPRVEAIWQHYRAEVLDVR